MTTDSIRFFAMRLCVHIDAQISMSMCAYRHKSYRHIGQNPNHQYTTAAAHRALIEFELMSSTKELLAIRLSLSGLDLGKILYSCKISLVASVCFETTR